MKKPEILCSVNAIWCATTANAAFALAGSSAAFVVGPPVLAVVCNVPAIGTGMVSGTSL